MAYRLKVPLGDVNRDVLVIPHHVIGSCFFIHYYVCRRMVDGKVREVVGKCQFTPGISLVVSSKVWK